MLGAVHFGSDAAARAQGRLAEETMAVTDWQLVGLVQGADGTLTTQDGDPQMILRHTVQGQPRKAAGRDIKRRTLHLREASA